MRQCGLFAIYIVLRVDHYLLEGGMKNRGKNCLQKQKGEINCWQTRAREEGNKKFAD